MKLKNMSLLMAFLLLLYALLYVSNQNPFLGLVLCITFLGMWLGVARAQSI